MTVLDTEQFKVKYPLIDEILYVDEMEEFLKSHEAAVVYVNSGINSDSGLKTDTPEDTICRKAVPNAIVNTAHMHNILSESRVIKSEEEIEMMRWASKITCEAHVNVMRNVKPGQRESQLESFFKYDTEQKYFCGRV